MNEPVEYRPSRLAMGVTAAILLLMNVGYGWMLGSPKDRLTGILGLIVFGGAFVATLFPLLRPRARLRFDAEGATETGHFGGENFALPWSNVLRVETFRWRRVSMLALVPFDADRALAGASPSMLKAVRGNERSYGRPYVIDARMYRQKTEALAAEIERRLAARPAASTVYPRPKGPELGNVPGRLR